MGMQHAGLVQGEDRGLPPRVGVLAGAVASDVISQVTGPHSVLTTPKVIELPSIEIRL